MYTIKSGAEFIDDIASLSPLLKDLRLSDVEIEKKTATIRYNFICNVTVDDELKGKILAEAEKITPKVFTTVQITVKKIVSNDQLINNEIFKFLKTNYPSVSIFLKQSDVRSVVYGDKVRYVLRLSKDGAEYVKRNGALNKLSDFLATRFCADFVGGTEEKEEEETVDLTDDEVYESELKKIELRTIKVENPRVIDDATLGDTAFYIEDVTDGPVVICGKITEIAERQTQKGKPFFIIHLNDTTGSISGIYFSKKNTYEKIKALGEGDSIIASGRLGDYNGRKSLTFEKINACEFPADFRKKPKFKNPVPKEYKLIFPSPAETVKVRSVFEKETEIPKSATGKTFVVFDIETTGIDVNNNDITEIGAVKIKDGVMTEQFTTLVKPDFQISQEITKLTGIDDEMVKNSPKFSAVLPDFLKFCENAIVVAHNGDGFDFKYIRKYAREYEYDFNNKTADSLILARKCLPSLNKFDLHTLADHFGVVFRHHRALSDAYATAEIFLELLKINENNKQNA